MSSCASTAGWKSGSSRSGRMSWRPWEIVAIVLGFIFVWPLALAYLLWRIWGSPVPAEMKAWFDRNISRAADFGSAGMRAGANLAFEEYRRGEMKRLDEERRRLNDERREFYAFVEELKLVKDREEFERYMRERRNRNAAESSGEAGPQTV